MLIHQYLNTAIKDFYTIRRGTVDDIGIEFEVEGKNLNPWSDSVWAVHNDGSLRHGGFEWVLSKPMPIAAIPKLVNQWFTRTKKENFEIAKSVRTSIHVHVNVEQFSLREVYNVITAYWLFEQLLCKYSGSNREGNLFCLRVKDADFILHALTDGLADGTFFNPLSSNEFKYAALNLQAVTKYNSLEFRMMRGEYSSPEFVIEWVQQLYNMVQKAKEFGNPKEIIQFFKNNSARDFLLKFFSTEFTVKITDGLSPAALATIMEDGFHYSFALATALDNWGITPVPDKTKEPIIPPRPKSKKLNPYSYPNQPVVINTDTISDYILTQGLVFNHTPPLSSNDNEDF